MAKEEKGRRQAKRRKGKSTIYFDLPFVSSFGPVFVLSLLSLSSISIYSYYAKVKLKEA